MDPPKDVLCRRCNAFALIEKLASDVKSRTFVGITADGACEPAKSWKDMYFVVKDFFEWKSVKIVAMASYIKVCSCLTNVNPNFYFNRNTILQSPLILEKVWLDVQANMKNKEHVFKNKKFSR